MSMPEDLNIELTEDIIGENAKSLCNPYWGKFALSEHKETADLTTPYCGPDVERFYAVRVQISQVIKDKDHPVPTTFYHSLWLGEDHGKLTLIHCRPSDRRVKFWIYMNDAKAVAVRLNEAITFLRTDTRFYRVNAMEGHIQVQFEEC